VVAGCGRGPERGPFQEWTEVFCPFRPRLAVGNAASIQKARTAIDSREDQLAELRNERLWQIGGVEGLGGAESVEDAGDLGPIVGKLASGVAEAVGEVRFAAGMEGVFITDETGRIPQGRAGNGQFPIEDSGYSPPAADAIHERVPVVEVSVDERLPVEFVRGLETPGGEAIESAAGVAHADTLFKNWTIEKVESWPLTEDFARQQSRGADGLKAGQRFSDGEGRLGHIVRAPVLLEFLKCHSLGISVNEPGTDVFVAGFVGKDEFGNWEGRGGGAENGSFFAAGGRVAPVEAQNDGGVRRAETDE